MFNEGKMDVVTYAHIGKYAENKFWNKASGLLDQMACAVGGLITIDFKNPEAPVVEKIDFDFGAQDHSLMIVNTGKGHADLSADYSSVPNEMKKVAQYFGKEVCAEISEEEVIANLAKVRAFAGDRSVMRAFHFFAGRKGPLGKCFCCLFGGNHSFGQFFLEMASECIHDCRRAGAGHQHCTGADGIVYREKRTRRVPGSWRRLCRCYHGDDSERSGGRVYRIY